MIFKRRDKLDLLTRKYFWKFMNILFISKTELTFTIISPSIKISKLINFKLVIFIFTLYYGVSKFQCDVCLIWAVQRLNNPFRIKFVLFCFFWLILALYWVLVIIFSILFPQSSKSFIFIPINTLPKRVAPSFNCNHLHLRPTTHYFSNRLLPFVDFLKKWKKIVGVKIDMIGIVVDGNYLTATWKPIFVFILIFQFYKLIFIEELY